MGRLCLILKRKIQTGWSQYYLQIVTTGPDIVATRRLTYIYIYVYILACRGGIWHRVMNIKSPLQFEGLRKFTFKTTLRYTATG